MKDLVVGEFTLVLSPLECLHVSLQHYVVPCPIFLLLLSDSPFLFLLLIGRRDFHNLLTVE